VNAALNGYALDKVATEYRDLETQLRGIGGVRDASLSLYSPMEGNNWDQGISIEDHPAPAGQRYSSSWDRVSPSFFNVLGSRMVHGRMFEERDLSAAQRVAVINQAFAEKFFAHEDPIGRRFGLGGDTHRADFQIIGVVENVRFRNPRKPTPPFFFVPLSQLTAAEWTQPESARSNMIGNIELLTSASAPTLASDVRRVLASVDPNFTMLNLVTLDDQIGTQVQHEKLISQLAELFGLLALVLASVGIYGLTAYSIQRRMNEMGIRTALGASRRDIIGLVLGGALKQIGIGLVIGIPAAYAAARILGDQLYGVKSYDALIFGSAILALISCTCLAAYLPAVRASSVDPVRALRAE
jgi:predicted permease